MGEKGEEGGRQSEIQIMTGEKPEGKRERGNRQLELGRKSNEKEKERQRMAGGKRRAHREGEKGGGGDGEEMTISINHHAFCSFIQLRVGVFLLYGLTPARNRVSSTVSWEPGRKNQKAGERDKMIASTGHKMLEVGVLPKLHHRDQW